MDINRYKSNGIYRIRNLINGFAYIGQTKTNFGDRWDSHMSLLNHGKHSNHALQNDWTEYGCDAFVFEVVIVVSDDDFDYDAAEMQCISEQRDQDKCYNVLNGGKTYPHTGKHLSDEIKKKIGEKNRIHQTGRKLSDDTKRKMSEAHKKRYSEWTSEERAEHGRKSSECARGYKWSDEAKAAFSKKQRETPNSAKFTEDDIRSIRKLREDGLAPKDIAAIYNTTVGYISSIVKRRRWSDI